jgi:glutamate carboxypeptidase
MSRDLGRASLVVVGLALIGGATMAAREQLTPEERTIVQHIDAHQEQALALLERAVNINSGTQNFAGVREVGKLFRAELDALGFKTQWVDGAAF